MSERWTERPELAALYDTECAGREDHDFYLQVAADLGAGSVVDIGCGTGVFALALAARGHTVTGVDPAAAMLDIARRRSAGTPIRWICGHVGDVHDASADLAVMMGHVAQYFVDDDVGRLGSLAPPPDEPRVDRARAVPVTADLGPASSKRRPNW